MTQLHFQGLAPTPHPVFKDERCAFSSCPDPARFLAIYFIMGHYNEDDDSPALLGYDCPFEDSPTIYGCNQPHLEQQIRENYEGKGNLVEEEIPDIIVNAQGSIQPELYDRILGRLEETLDSDFLTKKTYSFGRESLETLWKRES